jgi:hypothetical protein
MASSPSLPVPVALPCSRSLPLILPFPFPGPLSFAHFPSFALAIPSTKPISITGNEEPEREERAREADRCGEGSPFEGGLQHCCSAYVAWAPGYGLLATATGYCLCCETTPIATESVPTVSKLCQCNCPTTQPSPSGPCPAEPYLRQACCSRLTVAPLSTPQPKALTGLRDTMRYVGRSWCSCPAQ